MRARVFRILISTMSLPEARISIDQLREGLYVRLDDWLDHPFLFNSFKIRGEKQIQALRALGLTEITYIPGKSDAEPLPPPPKTAAPVVPPPTPTVDPEVEAMWKEKRERREKVAQHRAAVVQCERRFTQSVSSVKGLLRNLFSKPQESIGQAKNLVSDIVDSLLSEKEVVIHLMSTKSGDENAYYHALNVSVLSMLLAKEARVDADAMRVLGLGALLHDIGKERIPSQILLKKGPLTVAEQNFYQQHASYGVEMAAGLPHLPKGTLEIIAQHHEMLDGSGYPRGLRGDAMDGLARIVALVNAYDNACNRPNPADSLTPAESLAHMFKRQREQFDPVLLKLFIRCLGVYPPGSVVRLNNDDYGMVTSVNPDKLLQPTILLYDPGVPKEEAIFINLDDEPDLAIVQTLRPSALPKDVFEYLDPRTRINYFVDPNSNRKTN